MQCQFKIPVSWIDGLGNRRYTYVPCGRCQDCQKHIQSDWVFRLTQERKTAKFSYFLTLTYNNETLPKDSNLCYKDVQLFFARLRHHFKFRYFAIGEYGYNGTERPHYHIILFTEASPALCSYSLLHNVWNKGFISLDPCTDGRIKYVASYSSLSDVGRHRVRPFRHMSLRRPIGFDFVNTQAFKDCISRDTWTYGYFGSDGQRLRGLIPRYYRRYAEKFGYYTSPILQTSIIKPVSYRVINPYDFQSKYPKYSAPYCKPFFKDGFAVPESYYQRHRVNYDNLCLKKSRRNVRQHLNIPYDLWLLSTLRCDKLRYYYKFYHPSVYENNKKHPIACILSYDDYLKLKNDFYENPKNFSPSYFSIKNLKHHVYF